MSTSQDTHARARTYTLTLCLNNKHCSQQGTDQSVGQVLTSPSLHQFLTLHWPLCAGHGIAAQYRGGGPAATGGYKAYLFGDTLLIGTEIYKDELAQCATRS